MPNKTIKIRDFIIGDKAPVFMVAEIGINHNSSMDIAKSLLDAVVACGQWNLCHRRRPDSMMNIE